SPGQPAHHRGRARAAGALRGQGLREHRTLREHVLGEHPDRARRVRARRPPEAGRQAGVGRVRWRRHVGRRGDDVDAGGAARRRRPRASLWTDEDARGGVVKLAFLFPGQGAQAVGMGKALADGFPEARDAFATADRVLGFPLSELCWNGPAEELKKSVNTQPALLTHSVAALRLVEAAGLAPAFVAGHSLGEYSACVAAGAITFEDALTLTRTRGRLMYEAGLARPGAMAAVLGL